MNHRARDASTTPVGAAAIDEIGRCLHVIDGKAELTEISEFLERYEPERCNVTL